MMTFIKMSTLILIGMMILSVWSLDCDSNEEILVTITIETSSTTSQTVNLLDENSTTTLASIDFVDSFAYEVCLQGEAMYNLIWVSAEGGSIDIMATQAEYSYYETIVPSGPDYEVSFTVEYLYELEIVIVPDNFPNEVTWQLTDSSGDVIVSGTDNGTTIWLADEGNYEFTIYDSWSDGICCYNSIQGYYSLTINQETFFTSNGQYEASESVVFYIGNGQVSHLEEVTLYLELFSDTTHDVSWELMKWEGFLNTVINAGDYYGNNFVFVEDGAFELVMFDSDGNGMCCEDGEGFYQLVDYMGNELFVSNGVYGYEERTYFFLVNGTFSLYSDEYDALYGTTFGDIDTTVEYTDNGDGSEWWALLLIPLGLIMVVVTLMCTKQKRAEKKPNKANTERDDLPHDNVRDWVEEIELDDESENNDKQ